MTGRPRGQNKTLTIKQRRVEIYLPSLETKDEWNKAAEKRGQSLSEMVFLLVHRHLHGEDDESRRRVNALTKDVAKLETDLTNALSRVEIVEALNERLERDLRVYRTQEYTDQRTEAPMDARLIRLFRSSKDRDNRYVVLSEAELRKALRIPLRDHAGATALSAQLTLLERSGAVRKATGGWAWNG